MEGRRIDKITLVMTAEEARVLGELLEREKLRQDKHGQPYDNVVDKLHDILSDLVE